MKTRAFATLTAALLLLVFDPGVKTIVRAQSIPGSIPQGTFRFERPVTTGAPGPYRLAMDVPLLVGAAERASDLRLFDSSDRELPFLLVRPASAMPVWRRGALLAIAPTENDTVKTSGFEADLGDTVNIDRFRVRGLPPGFLKRVTLEGSGDRTRWTLLVPQGTLFDLPDEHLQQLELSFTAGVYRYLRATWDDSNSGKVPLPNSAEARRVVENAASAPLRGAVEFQKRPSEPGRSRYSIRLPGPHLPIVALILDVSADRVLRDAEVTETRLSGLEASPAVLGRATLRRAVINNIAASDLRIPIDTPREPVIDLSIEDNDSPAITLNGVTVEFGELPWIYFDADGGPITARYGGENRQTPRYDLEAVRPTLRIDAVSEAKWGEPRSLTPAPAEARPPQPMPLEGAAIDVNLFRRVRDIPAGDAGLVAVPLDAAVLAESDGPGRSFSDLRIIDAAGRQVPYLIERRNEPLTLDLSLAPATSAVVDTMGGRRSLYRVKLPFTELPGARLVLSTESRVFDRAVQVGIEHAPDRHRRDPWFESLATARWVNADQERAAQPLQLTLNTLDATDLLLIIDEGDNRALPLGPPRLLLPSYRVRFYRPAATPLKLAYGRDDLTAPRYDLALLAPQVLGVAATEVVAGILSPTAAAAPTTKLSSPYLFWGVLSLAVVVLVGFVVRLVRKTN